MSTTLMPAVLSARRSAVDSGRAPVTDHRSRRASLSARSGWPHPRPSLYGAQFSQPGAVLPVGAEADGEGRLAGECRQDNLGEWH